MKPHQLITATSVILLVATTDVTAQTCDLNLDLSWNSIDNGGGVSIAGDLELMGTVGQTEIGEMTSGNLSLTGGFRFVKLPRSGDVDGNRFVDLLDYAHFLDCMTGPADGPVPVECRFTDFDANTTVDLADIAILQVEFGTPPPRTQVRWTNKFGGDWAAGANWDTGFAPDHHHEAVIDLAGDYTILVSADASVGSLRLCAAGARLRVAPTAPFGGDVEFIIEEGLTNTGTIDLSSDSLDWTHDPTITLLRGVLVNAPGATILSSAGVIPGNRYLDAQIKNEGTIRMEAHYTEINNSDSAFISTAGTVHVESGSKMSINGGITYIEAGTTLGGTGTFDWSGAEATVLIEDDITNHPSEDGMMFSFSGDVTIDGPGTLTNEGSLTFRNDTVNVDLINDGAITIHRGVLFNLPSHPLANLSNGSIRIASDDGSPVALTLEEGFINHGTIELSWDGGASSAAGATLRVIRGTLINASGGILKSTEPAHNTDRTIDAEIDNQGTIDARHRLTILNENRKFVSTSGTMSVESGLGPLSIVGGLVELGSQTTFLGTGTIDFAGPPMTLALHGDVTNQAGGIGPRLAFSSDVTIDGSGTLTNEGSLSFRNDTINVDLINDGSIRVRQGVRFNMLNNPLANLSNGNIRIASDDGNPVRLDVQDGFTNHGTIELSWDDGASSAASATLRVVNGSLINAPGGILKSTEPAHNTGRTIEAVVANQGTIDVQHALTINHAGAGHSNNGLITADRNLTILQTADGSFTNTIDGTIEIEAATTVMVSGGSCINDGVVMGTGTFVCE